MKLKTVGQIVDAHGIKGELKIRLFSQELDWHDDFVNAYVDDHEYFIEHLKPNKTFWILKLEGLSDRNQAELLKGKELQALETLFMTADGEEPYLSELLNYSVDLEGKIVGQVVSFQETQAHHLLVIQNETGAFEIPYVDAFIKSIDREKQILSMNFPEDLLSEDFKIKN